MTWTECIHLAAIGYHHLPFRLASAFRQEACIGRSVYFWTNCQILLPTHDLSHFFTQCFLSTTPQ